MDLNLKVNFKNHKDEIVCVIMLDNQIFSKVQRIRCEADRIDGYKRAKELAYLGAMIKVHGYVCKRKLKEIEL